jgi:shikimate kinase/3-dehydroquinate synthase
VDPSPIFLIGFMATGKTTVGRRAAQELSRRFVDLDEQIEKAAGQTVAQIFASGGEARFRALEAQSVGEVAKLEGVVVACGGGTPCFGDNLARMRQGGVVVALRASIGEILRRVADPASRPLLGGAEGSLAEAERLYAAREAVYHRADAVIDTDGKAVAEVAGEVVRRAALRLGDIRVALGERSVPIHLGPLASVAELLSELVAGATRVAMVTDQNVARAGHAQTVRAALEGAGHTVVEVVLAPGEQHKNLAEAGRVASALVEAGLDRQSVVVAVGGGVVGDLAGFVASVFLRGIACAQVPTTLLAMVDSAIGGKTGVDLPAGKNLVGTFWQPRFVLADPSVLATLPAREMRAALAEVLKYGLLFDPPLFERLRAEGPPTDLTDIVSRCARWKAGVVAKDERETRSAEGGRALLNLGHTVGHAIEAASGATTGERGALLHGEAIALGLIAAARVSERLGCAPPGLEAPIAATVEGLGLDAKLGPWLNDAVFSYLSVDKKRAGKKIRFVALEAVGRTRVVELGPEEIGRILRSS